MASEAQQGRYQKIHKAVLAVPYGKVVSYGQIADLAGLPGRARMVGKAMGHAPPDLRLPWYRVLRSSGEIAFPPGSEGCMEQTALLRDEGVKVVNNRVNMKTYQWRPGMDEILFGLDF